ncbi:DUF2141 domain-containing protein [Imperialibacter roseus]|uniref:DUF2141 domain-containing protein n=1 Tax=Imperialibacter roseus TaxID=1324217 RepID=A0ABZ0IVB5_9BACT|nr:DUF2141 domain-containing protein [Imperialibacter roseus]WOK08716.1 DUF2141 domain-containing protein [Imperialibacter roseus]
MKNVLMMILLLAGIESQAGDNQGKLVVKVTNLGDLKGQVMVGLFDKEDNFLKKPVKGVSAKATAEGQELVFENLPYGEYAVSVIHDENENGELDTFLVIPTEPYGFSNNVMGKFGPPSFEQTKISFKKDTSVEIKLNR